MKTNSLLKAGLFTTLLASSSAFAHVNISSEQCDIELNYDLSISPKHIRIIDKEQTMVDIYEDKMVFIKGEQVDLTANQQALVSDYANHIRQSMPEVALIATEAVNIAYQGISAAMGNMVDLSETKEKFDQLEQGINDKFNSRNGYYRFSQGTFKTNAENTEVKVMVEEVVKDMLPKLIGSLMVNIGSAMAGGETSFKDLENLGDRVEKEVEKRAEVLKQRAEAFCGRLKEVDKMEQALVAQNANFTYFNLLKVN